MRWIQTDGQRFEDAAVFFRVKEEWGCLSNMAGGFPLVVCGYDVPSSEALYQAMRFPGYPEIQLEIITQGSPMAAKMMAKKERRRELLTRADWSQIQLDVMRWCLRVKLVQSFGEFFETLMASENRPIVERSRKDRFWGAVLEDDGHLHGENWLGRLLMELRGEVTAWLNSDEEDAPYPIVIPPTIENFRLLETEVGVIGAV